MELDWMDRKILRELQKDCARPIAELAEIVGLSSNPCWRRIKRLEQEGLIKRRVAILDSDRLGVGMTIFAAIKTNDHSEAWLERFVTAARQIEEIVEIHRMAGDIDYLLKIVVADIGQYDGIYKRLIQAVPIADVSARFSMERIKETSEIPLGGRR